MGFNQKINDSMNNMSRSVTTQMMKDAPPDLKYVYIGPVDEKTRDFCIEAASQGALTEAQILELGGEYAESLVSGGGINCRHNWELASDDIQSQFHRGGEAQKIIEDKMQKKDIVNWQPTMSKELADKFVKQSTIKDTVYHGTTFESSEKIASGGFSLSKTTTGRIYGDGVYLTTKLKDAAAFSNQWNAGTTAVMPIKINVKKIFTFPADRLKQSPLRKKIAKEITEDIPYTQKITKYFQDRGYDGVKIPQGVYFEDGVKKYSHDWLVIFDPKKITTLEN